MITTREQVRQRALLLAQAYVLMALDALESAAQMPDGITLEPVMDKLAAIVQGSEEAIDCEIAQDIDDNPYYEAMRQNHRPEEVEATVSVMIDRALREDEARIESTFDFDDDFDDDEFDFDDEFDAALAECEAKGHDWAEESADVENGSAEMVCRRCGTVETVYMG